MTYQRLCFAVSLLLLCHVRPALAWEIGGRCARDNQTTENGMRRNAWAVKCNYMPAALAPALDGERMYYTFDIDAPVDPAAPCTDAHVLGCCQANGCYTPDQHLMFSGDYRPIGEVLSSRPKTVTAVTGLNMSGVAGLREEPIKAFVEGDTDEDVVALTAGRSRLQVTMNHPMVLASGDIVEAGSVKPGMALLTVDGPQRVTNAHVTRYSGKVWNVRPESTQTEANILIAEGMLTGSIRYQNEWREEESRLHLRDLMKSVQP